MSTAAARQTNAQALLDAIRGRAVGVLLEAKLNLGDAEVRIAAAEVQPFFRQLRDDPDFQFDFPVSVTAVDYMDRDFVARAEKGRFEVVYHLMSVAKRHRLCVKVSLPEDNPEVESITSFWPGANFMEREVWDMFGIVFKNHPNLRRVLMYDEFVGHPLRKDYPLQGKQPRVALRHPEVLNTSRDMRRPPLAGIGCRSGTSSKQAGSKG